MLNCDNCAHNSYCLCSTCFKHNSMACPCPPGCRGRLNDVIYECPFYYVKEEEEK